MEALCETVHFSGSQLLHDLAWYLQRQRAYLGSPHSMAHPPCSASKVKGIRVSGKSACAHMEQLSAAKELNSISDAQAEYTDAQDEYTAFQIHRLKSCWTNL